jgi:hypothetical protein
VRSLRVRAVRWPLLDTAMSAAGSKVSVQVAGRLG